MHYTQNHPPLPLLELCLLGLFLLPFLKILDLTQIETLFEFHQRLQTNVLLELQTLDLNIHIKLLTVLINS